MDLEIDVRLHWQAAAASSVSRARVYHSDFWWVLLLTEIPGNSNGLLSDGIPVAVQQAIKEFRLAPARLVCIEHLPIGYSPDQDKDEFKLVWFNYNPKTKTLEQPCRVCLEAGEVEAILAGIDYLLQQIQRLCFEKPSVSGE